MKFELTGKYKSLENFSTPKIGDFCVITGLNGAGKSQFLELINSLQNTDQYRGNFDRKSFLFNSHSGNLGKIKYIEYNALNPNNLGKTNKQGVERIKNSIFSSVRSSNQNQPHFKNLAISIAQKLGKDLNTLTQQDILDYPLTSEEIGINDIFQVNLGQLFYNYAFNLAKNNYHTYRNQKFEKNWAILNSEEFDKKYTNPWELINRFLDITKSDYFVEGIEEEEFSEHINVIPVFINKLTGDEVGVNSLSSGEKVIISLASCLFNIELDDYDVFPRVILMDEPDAPLHPLMTRDFLNVIHKELVEKKGIKVILTTHSPSTIALVPERHIYCMNKTGKRFEKISKDKALGLLTSGLNTISIDYENRRQVFVESNYDCKFYEKIYEKSKLEINPEISLSFISSGIDKKPIGDKIGDGDCVRVKAIVEKLVTGGNKQVFGIIDWDTKNNPSQNIIVNGHKKRYNIESYIFDPIILAAFLLDFQIIERNKLSLNNNENYTDFISFSEEKLNNLATTVVNQIKSQLDNSPTCKSTIKVLYSNGKSIDIPKWYLVYPGHKLERTILKTYPTLRSEFGPKVRLPDIPKELEKEKKEKKKKENAILFENQLINIIKNKIVNKIYDNIPEWISQDLIDTLKQIQK